MKNTNQNRTTSQYMDSVYRSGAIWNITLMIILIGLRSARVL